MKVLFAYDGSEEAKLAARLLAALPLPVGSEIDIMTIVAKVDFSRAFINDKTQQWTREYYQVTIDEAKSKQNDILSFFQDQPWEVRTEVEAGDPATALIDLAEARKTDLIVVGSRGLSGIKKYFLGSVSHKLLKHAPCSVLVGRNPMQQIPKKAKLKFVLAYDGSKPAEKMVGSAKKLDLGNIQKLSFLHVVETSVDIKFTDDIGLYLSQLKEDEKRITGEMQAFQASLKEAFPQLKVETEVIEKEKNVGQTIIDYAIKQNSDIVFVASSGKTGLDNILLGSISQKVAEHSHNSVWVYREKS